MKHYIVKFQKIYDCSVELEANSEEEAIELAKTASWNDINEVFVEFDYYEAEKLWDSNGEGVYETIK
jgi:hypothetical protein